MLIMFVIFLEEGFVINIIFLYRTKQYYKINFVYLYILEE
jgi:hypothetical protein